MNEHYWRSIAAEVSTEGEFPPGADLPPDGLTRRELLELLGGSLALAGLSGCATYEPDAVIVPYRDQPPEVTPGRATHYATSMVLDGFATGLIATSQVGRPVKLEGNPQHPASLGATSVFEQASIYGLYDPTRARSVMEDGATSGFGAFSREVADLRARLGHGRGLHVLAEPTGSPFDAWVHARLLAQFPEARVSYFAPLSRASRFSASQLAFGKVAEPIIDFEKTRVVASFGDDFLTQGPLATRYSRDFAKQRAPSRARPEMNRLYVAEPRLSCTGAMADHRLAARPSELKDLLALLFAEVATRLTASESGGARLVATLQPREALVKEAAWVRALAADLVAARGECVVLAGDMLPPESQALAHALNEILSAHITYVASTLAGAGEPAYGLDALYGELETGAVDTLVVTAVNPAFASPRLAAAMGAARRRIYCGLYDDETARLCQWFLPAAHYLEAWGDARAYDGTVSMVQPLVRPLYGGKSAAEVLLMLAEATPPGPYDALVASFTDRGGEAALKAALKSGLVLGSASPRLEVAVDWARLIDAHTKAEELVTGLELVLAPCSKVYDGRFASNLWLQELPEPVTKLTWDNAAEMSPATAKRLELESGDVVRLRSGERTVEAPVLVAPGCADETVYLALGYGGIAGGGPASKVGANGYSLRSGPVTVERTGAHHDLAITQEHFGLEGRPIALTTSLAQVRAGYELPLALRAENASMRTLVPNAPLQWGMAIDLSRCTGCSACVIACQAENNIPVVGKSGVKKSREMHWLRIDRYFEGPLATPRVVMQPMLCQHCEKAPCEYVCPTHATVHSPDGLNEMVYNRCVGTRFCSNNCPYKVRRFNWFNYHRDTPAPLAMLMNPDVTVRARGVMEKCTYCVQRIRRAGIVERVSGKPTADGELVTACAQACPTQAITFGNVRDPKSAVSQLHASERTFEVLHELGTAPRTRYLVRVQNPGESA